MLIIKAGKLMPAGH